MSCSQDTVRNWIRESKHLVVLTGAGVSAESGIPTFRGMGGFWKQFRAEDLATPEAFARDPKTVWEWYDWRRGLIAKAEPNPGHHAIAAMESIGPEFTLLTQNVDGLHRRAGSKKMLEIHGSIWQLRCMKCREANEDLRVPLGELPPMCKCGGMLRPGVVWFGEGLDPVVWDNAEKAARRADLMLVVGTSAVVYPAASLIPLAKQSGARIVEINTDATPMSGFVDCSLTGASGEILPRLLP